MEDARTGPGPVQERAIAYLRRELKVSQEKAYLAVQALMEPSEPDTEAPEPDPETVWDQLNTEGGS
jgi:hypothetical protein